jgi:hypothetical protein
MAANLSLPNLTTTGNVTASGSVTSPQIDKAYHTSAFPSTCTVNGVAYTTAGDCAFYTALNAASTTGLNQILIVDQGETDTCAGWDAPILTNGASVSVIGAAIYAGSWDMGTFQPSAVSRLKQTCSIGTKAVITYESGAGATGSNGPTIALKGVYIDANGEAGACGDLLRMSRSSIADDVCVGVTGTHRHGFQFGNHTAGGNGWVFETDVTNLTVYTNTLNPMTQGAGSVTVSGGAATGYTVTGHGGVGTFTHPTTDYQVVFTGWGVGVSQPNGPEPCAVLPTAHVTDLTGGQFWAMQIDTPGSGCDPNNTFFDVISNPVMDEAFLFDDFTDSLVANIVSMGPANTASAYVSSSSSGFTLKNFHAYGGEFSALTLDGQGVDVESLQCDTPLQVCVVNRARGSVVHGGYRIHVNYLPGAGDFWDTNPKNTTWGPSSGCGTTVPPLVGYNTFGSITGPIDSSISGSAQNGGGLLMAGVQKCSVDNINQGATISVTPAPASVGGTTTFGTNIAGVGQATCTATAGAGDPIMGLYPDYNQATGLITFPHDLYSNGGSILCVPKEGNILIRTIPSTGATTQTFDLTTLLSAPVTGSTTQHFFSNLDVHGNTVNVYGGTTGTTYVNALGPNTTTAGILQLHTLNSDGSGSNFGAYLDASGNVLLGNYKTFFDNGGSLNDRGSANTSGLVPGGWMMDDNSGAGLRLGGMGTSATTAQPMSLYSYSSDYSHYFGMISLNPAGFVQVGGAVNAGFDQGGDVVATSIQTINGTVIPSSATGYHGTSGTKVQMSDGTGASGDLAKFASDGSITDGGSGSLEAAVTGVRNGNGATADTAATSHNLSAPANCVAASGSGTAYTCTTAPTFTPAAGDHIQFKADVANSASATLAVNGATAATIKKWGNSSNLIANDLLAGHWVAATFDGANWQLEGQLGNANTKQINGVTVSGLATGLLKNTTGTGVPTIAVAGTDYALPNANTTGTAAGLSAVSALPNGTTATTQAATDSSTKVATTAYVASPGAITPTTVTASGIVTGGNDTTRTTATTIATTAFTTTGLVLPTVPANTTKNGRCNILWQMSSTAYTATFGVGMSNAPTGLWGGTSVTYAAAGTLNWLAFSQTATAATAISSATTAGATGTTYRAEVDFTLQTGASNPVAVTLYGQVSNTGATLTIEPGSVCYWHP